MNNKDSQIVGRENEAVRSGATLKVSNIGGIDTSQIDLEPGVNVLVGRNATNRTSHLQALMAVCGSDDISIKSSEEHAEVTLDIDGENYTREFDRENGGATSSGDPLLENPELGELFAFLLRSNEARQAVVQGNDLRELIMRPVDTESIDEEIDEILARRDEIDSQLERVNDLESRLPSLRQEYEEYQRKIEAQKKKREDLRKRIEEADADIQESKKERAELDEKLSELQDLRSDLESVRFRIETEENSIDSLQDERAELKEELESLSVSAQDSSNLKKEIDRLQQRKEQLDSTIDQVRSVVQFNQEMLDENADFRRFLDETSQEDGNSSPTDQLLPDNEQTIVCWTCGSDVVHDDISSMLTQLQDVSKEILSIRRSVKSDLEDRRREKKEIERAQNRRSQVERKLDQIDQELEERKETLETLEAEKEELKNDIEDLEDDIEDTQDSNYERVLQLHKEANEVEFEIERLEEAKKESTEKIEEIETELETYDDLEQTREELSDRLTSLRTRIDRLEQSAVDAFNEHMGEVLQLLDYQNIERVWIEQKEDHVSKGRGSTTESTFELHITRSTESGSVFNDTVDNLSESEREVIGLVFALSGYLVHEVYEQVPFMLLDSLEAIDSERISSLVEYLDGYADYLVVALLEEDARALSDEYNEITATA